MNTDTPETDNHYYPDFEQGGDVVFADFARKLERERDEALFDLDFGRRLTTLLHQQIEDIVCERDALRDIFPEILIALQSGNCAADCSVDFLQEIPKEVRLVRQRLERERDKWKAKYIQQNKDLGCEMMDPNGTIWDYAKKLQTTVTEQRDAVTLRLGETQERMIDAERQRDRLAEALQNIVSIYENPAKGCIPCSSDMYDEALQSLTPNAEP
jgi:hypothetical protein